MGGAVGRAEVDQLVNIILHASFPEDGICYQGSAHAAHHEAIRGCRPIDVVCGLPTSPRCHVLHDYGRVSRNMFA